MKLTADHRLALFMEGAFADNTGKMGLGILRYSSHQVVCMIDTLNAGGDSVALTRIDRPTPIVASLKEAKALGANVLVLGIAPPGGQIPGAWKPWLDEAVAMGFSLVNGLHEPLEPKYPALQLGQWIWDVRREPQGLQPGTGAARNLTNKRLLMIGTDMSVGKMTAGLEIVKSAKQAGIDARFVATGQIGITISGSGIPLDAVRLDFAAGAIEKEVLAAAEAELVVVEGQGSLIHPGSSATLPLIRGCCPTHFVLCHRAAMEVIPRNPWVVVPPLLDLIKLYQDIAEAGGVFQRPVISGIALNTGQLDEEQARDACSDLEQSLNLPVVDVVRDGAMRLISGLGPAS